MSWRAAVHVERRLEWGRGMFLSICKTPSPRTPRKDYDIPWRRAEVQGEQAGAGICHNMCLTWSRFLNFSTTDNWDQIILCCGDHPVHCRMFGSIPDLYSWDASNNPSPTLWRKMSPDIVKCPLGANLPRQRTTDLLEVQLQSGLVKIIAW